MPLFRSSSLRHGETTIWMGEPFAPYVGDAYKGANGRILLAGYDTNGVIHAEGRRNLPGLQP